MGKAAGSGKRRVERVLHFDFHGLQQRAYVGVRRAAAFLGLSERFLEGDIPRSLTLGSKVRRSFLPDPFPEELLSELRESWRSWIIGNALRELDQFLSLFLDEAFDLVQQAKLVSGDHPSNYVWERIDRTTNVADKHKRVLLEANCFVGQHTDDQECLVSLSNARNCISHDLGVVTPKRAVDGMLIVRWLAVRLVVEQGDKTFAFIEEALPFETDPHFPEARAMMRVEVVDRRFAVGDRLDFTPDNLLEICLFYNILFDRVAQAIAEYAQHCGVKFAAPQSGAQEQGKI